MDCLKESIPSGASMNCFVSRGREVRGKTSTSIYAHYVNSARASVPIFKVHFRTKMIYGSNLGAVNGKITSHGCTDSHVRGSHGFTDSHGGHMVVATAIFRVT